MQEELARLFAARKGHFRLESGHHGDLWLDLELLCWKPARVKQFAAKLAKRISRHDVEVVCGPLVEGAFVALLVAAKLEMEFFYSERIPHPDRDALFPVEYRVPAALRERVRGKRVAIVNDVINAGSAARGTFADLKACEAEPVVLGALLVLGSPAKTFAAEKNIVLETIATLPNTVWEPSQCPLCASQVPLDEIGDASCAGKAFLRQD